ncbi:hypothetical protein [Arenimonas oryziterrae]|uniref:Uncharacterized protein n=1 Tax=Arenimonas oryziterrae DSM 21050 = YC6267 TaxID=1121015 RepID=A0A091AVY8_9GAMM|nr:hypothetical protein [Arenimonas oryziterrae]KFN44428.1 hypothetical protein N789_00035 [Arenimonas oryziterrae DSM 21050 = YC6267]
MSLGTPQIHITVEYRGRRYEGFYTVKGTLLTVRTDYGFSSTQIGELSADLLARELMRNVLEAAEQRGEFGIPSAS